MLGGHSKYFARVSDAAGNGSGGDHDGRHQDRAARGAALAAFEIAIR